MNQKTLLKLTALCLSGAMLVAAPAAGAKSPPPASQSAAPPASQSASCKIENRVQSGFTVPKVYEFGDLKLRTQEEHPQPWIERGQQNPEYYAVFDLKTSSGYIKRDLRMRVGEKFTDTICGSEVTILLQSNTTIVVSSF